METQTHENPSPGTLPEPPTSAFPASVVDKVKANLVFKSKWAELNGAMGDLGTYIPIVLALTLARDLDLGTTLIFTGVYNIVTGAIYGVPMPVQPMKSIAAVAISNHAFGIPEVMAAGIWTAAILFVLGVTGLMQVVYKLIPLSVVRGIQLAQGLYFAMTAVKYIRKEQNFSQSKSAGERPWLGLDGLVLALVCAAFIIFVNGAGDDEDDQSDETTSRKRNRLRKFIANLPSAFIIFLLGIILSILREPRAVKGFKFGPSSLEVVKISKQAWKEGFLKGTVPQLPLSILNSVVAVCKLSSDLFPGKEFTATSVAVTVGAMNLVGCWFGAMPCCHGAGGLAGQYKFGGRSGGCVAVGLVLGSSFVRVLERFPVGVLGVLLLFAGIELAMCSRDMNTKEDSFVMLLCTAVSLVGSSAAIGFVCGILAHLLLNLRRVRRLGQRQSLLANV
ncbi:molybdate transporter 1 [Diospyros lotus]|uniref:molybdate transporter 1 n=1 Tax=Diospyros lotus TaxID=55363 RepID=UPI00225054D0|nr:molybdate transporter 1 [Diospyros lotus]